MFRDINGKEFDFNCRLGATVRIKAKFKKTYNQVISELEKLDATELTDLLYCGLSKEDVSESDFKNHVFENCGMGDLIDHVMWFVQQIQYPGLSEEEIEKKFAEKKAKQARLEKADLED